MGRPLAFVRACRVYVAAVLSFVGFREWVVRPAAYHVLPAIAVPGRWSAVGLPFALCNAYANYLSLHLCTKKAPYVAQCRLAWCVVSAFGINWGLAPPTYNGVFPDTWSLCGVAPYDNRSGGALCAIMWDADTHTYWCCHVGGALSRRPLHLHGSGTHCRPLPPRRMARSPLWDDDEWV